MKTQAIWLMLQQDDPDDYVIATNETHQVGEFAELVFGYLGLNWKDHVRSDEQFFRPAEVHLLKGDYAKGKRGLGWEPKVRCRELVKTMVDADQQNRDRSTVREASMRSRGVCLLIPGKLVASFQSIRRSVVAALVPGMRYVDSVCDRNYI